MKVDTELGAFINFTDRLQLFVKKNPDLMNLTLSNIFTMRLIGNKTHGDLAEIGIAEFINQYMYDFRSVHVGKDLFRAKSKEEDITVTDELSGIEIPISLKAYGHGPLQLSTDKNSLMFPLLETLGEGTTDRKKISKIISNRVFSDFDDVNVLPLIYHEKKKLCNILVFDYMRALKSVASITRIEKGNGRIHPVYRFHDEAGEYICEIRYGDAKANALQRGLWTHTKNAFSFFDSITNGWINYSHNLSLVTLFSRALVSNPQGHNDAIVQLDKDISKIKKQYGLS